jgi:hypothetical protein
MAKNKNPKDYPTLLQIGDVVKVKKGTLNCGYDVVEHHTNKFATTSRGYRLRREIDSKGFIKFTSSPTNIGYSARYGVLKKHGVEYYNQQLAFTYKKEIIDRVKDIKTESLTQELLTLYEFIKKEE